MSSPRFQTSKVRFSGIGSGKITALGEFRAHIMVDENSYPITIRVISDNVLRQKLLIGTDFLDTVEVNVKQGEIKINSISKKTVDEDSSASIFQIDVERACESNAMSHIHDKYR